MVFSHEAATMQSGRATQTELYKTIWGFDTATASVDPFFSAAAEGSRFAPGPCGYHKLQLTLWQLPKGTPKHPTALKP